MISRRTLLEALAATLSYDGYLREQSWEGLRGEDEKATRTGGKLKVALKLGPRRRGESRKTGSDQGVEVEDEWVEPALENLARQLVPEDLVFIFDQIHFWPEWGVV